MKLYQQIAALFQAFSNCVASGNSEWIDRHEQRIEKLVRDHLPSGSGFDSGTKLDFEKSKPNRLVFTTSFHHMNDGGYYDGWTDHCVIVTPDLVSEFDVHITGHDRGHIKEYIAETFATALNADLPTTEKC